jgi:dimeric dUTPase (all-alpha-NTP-PPase superfamily)
MEVRATLKPGVNGIKKYLQKYGGQLVCVRYRYDKERNKRQTTIELIVDEQDWMPGYNIRPDQVVAIKIEFGEMALREQVKTAGAHWDKKQKAWLLSLKEVYKLGLEKRIIDELGF